MATELDLEQLRQLFTSLGDRLANSKGDANTVAKLTALEKALKELAKQQADYSKKSKDQVKKDQDDLVKNLVKSLEDSEINKNLKDSIGSGAGAGQDRLDGGILNEFKGFKGLGGKVGGSILAFGKLTAGLGKATTALAVNTKQIDGTFSGLFKAFGMTGATSTAIAAAADEQIDAYRILLNSAEGTVKGIIDMRDAASNAGLGVMEFAKAVAEGTQGSRLFGGQNWGNLYKGIKEQTKNMAYYGYSTDQLVSAQNEYLDSLANSGDIFGKRDDEIIKGFDELLKSSDKTATILGMNRQDVLKANAAQARDATAQAVLKAMGLDAGQKQQADSFQTFADKNGLGALNKAMMANQGNGYGSDTESAVIASQLPGVSEILKETFELTKAGQLDEKKRSEQQEKLITQIRAAGDNKDLLKTLASRSINGNAGNAKELLEIIQAANKTQITGDNQEKTNQGSNLTDEFSKSMLRLSHQMKDAAAGVQQFITELMRPWINYFRESFGPLSDSIDSVISSFRGLISGLSNFSGAMMAVGGVIASGVIITKAAGLVSSIVAAGLLPRLSSILLGALRPIAALTNGIGFLGKLLVNNTFTRAIAGAVTSGLGPLGRMIGGQFSGLLKALPSVLGKASGYIAAAVAAHEVGKAGGEAAGNYLVNNHPEIAAWLSENVFGNGKVDPEVVKQARANVDKGLNADGTDPNAPDEPPAETPAPEVTTPATPVDNSVDTTAITDSIGASELTTAIQANTASTVTLNDTIKAQSIAGASLGESASTTYDEFVKNIQAVDDARIAQTDKQNQIASSFASEVQPTQPLVDSAQLDAAGIAKAIADAGKDSQAQIAAMGSALERINAVLKQMLDYSQQSGAIERQSLADIAKYQEDLIRITRR